MYVANQLSDHIYNNVYLQHHET